MLNHVTNGLYPNADETEYISISKDDFELIEIAEQKALFTNNRLTDKDIPKGLYCYHLRESDNGERFVAIEKNVMVNHGGTIICSEPIDLGKQGYIPLNDESSPNFVGEQYTMEEFMEGIEPTPKMEITQL